LLLRLHLVFQRRDSCILFLHKLLQALDRGDATPSASIMLMPFGFAEAECCMKVLRQRSRVAGSPPPSRLRILGVGKAPTEVRYSRLYNKRTSSPKLVLF
jgi:hypothetical protein